MLQRDANPFGPIGSCRVGEEMEKDVRERYVSPAIDQLAFNCPHCGALAKQFWFLVDARQLPTDQGSMIITAETVKALKEEEVKALGNLEMKCVKAITVE